jgi:plasmid stabilization system protein ParE
MAYKVIIEQHAVDDAAQIYDYYNDTKFVAQFQIKYSNAITLVEMFPKIGEMLAGDVNYRKIIIMKRLAMIYEIKDKVIRIVRVVDGRTDYDS